ncbi:methyltransferase domain-containing protein [Nocardia stercoris]|uniref:Methyltransferase domain-containing protein n=1 Tax=Nocardia stercoris TaxID=2483361 RepID=A0A3M2LA59_9NOCA|nr:methyltransferase domain-containing protein [Nocardia stercoris]RMI34471.1 methyltransferase domain-containing protein [Nocardia stercoris]
MWDPVQYLAFDNHRARPFFELVARIRAEHPRRVVDLGCGPGHLTGTLADRWPEAIVEASDNDPAMVTAARARGIQAELLDVRDWKPAADTDVVVSNAVLHWVPDHAELLTRWARELPGGAWIAIQVPSAFDSPSHRCIQDLADRPEWRDRLAAVRGQGPEAVAERDHAGPPRTASRHRAGILQPDSVLDPIGYANVLSDAGAEVDAWETTYIQRLSGENPVLTWVSGTALRPVRDALDDAEWARFTAELAPLLAAAYPRRPDGSTWLPYRRVFTVARTAG